MKYMSHSTPGLWVSLKQYQQQVHALLSDLQRM